MYKITQTLEFEKLQINPSSYQVFQDDPENPKYIKTIPGVGYRFEGKEGI